jgi:glycosyltransferase involved in cell wall biosynthesis
MRICLIIDDYLPGSIKVGAKMMHELAVELVTCGHTVTVITPDPELSTRAETTVIDGVSVCRFRSGRIKNISKAKRAVNETLLSYFAWTIYKDFFKQNPHELIAYYSPTIFWGPLVAKLKRLWGARSYLILRDFFPQWVIDNGMLSANSPITKYFRFFERLNYRAADTIGVQSPANLTLLKRNTRLKMPLEVLYNWASNDPPVAKGMYYRETLGLQDKVVFFYGGNIGPAQDMMNIVRLSHAMRNEKKVHFVLVGNGDEVELVRTAIEQGLAGNMTLLLSVTQEEFVQMLAEFDVGLFSLHRDHTTHNFPGKLLEYMRQRKPILGSINPGNDLQLTVESFGAGLISVNGDDASFLSNALSLLRDDRRRSAMGANGAELLASKFSVSSAALQILRGAEANLFS